MIFREPRALPVSVPPLSTTKMMMTPLPPADISIPSLSAFSLSGVRGAFIYPSIHLVGAGAAAGRVAKIDHAVDDISLAGKRKMSERVGGRPATSQRGGNTNRVTHQQPFLAKYTLLQSHKLPLIFAIRLQC